MLYAKQSGKARILRKPMQLNSRRQLLGKHHILPVLAHPKMLSILALCMREVGNRLQEEFTALNRNDLFRELS